MPYQYVRFGLNISMSGDPKKWVKSELSRILGFDAVDDIVEYLMGMDDEKELEEYVSAFLGDNAPEFLHGYRSRLPSGMAKASAPTTVVASSKPTVATSTTQPVAGVSNKSGQASQTKGKKGTKMGTSGLIPGRATCHCQATKHALFTNCLACGRIICEQEGEGPCYFCGNYVDKEGTFAATPDGRKSKKSAVAVSSEAAEKHKNKLLEYDRTSAKRTVVLDDQEDYYQADANAWLDEGEREALRLKEEAMRREKEEAKKKKYTFDFAGRRVIVENDSKSTGGPAESSRKDEFDILEKLASTHIANHEQPIYANVSGERSRPVFVNRTAVGSTKAGASDKPLGPTVRPNRLQHDTPFDNDFGKSLEGPSGNMETVTGHGDYVAKNEDKGMCLSMHQPWASLLVHGIKRVEGRSWYTEHRGRLWIASTSQAVDDDVVAQCEQACRDHYARMGVPPPKFPSTYPSSALLGYVDVFDCITSEEYTERMPPRRFEENGSAYLFLCCNPTRLVVPFQVSGQHKIWPLESKHHSQACQALIPVPQLKPITENLLKTESFDIMLKESCQKQPRFTKAASAKQTKVLRDGMVLFKAWLPPEAQRELLQHVRADGLDANHGGFVQPKFESGGKMSVRQFCYGKHWNNETSVYETTRHFDDAEIPPVPALLRKIVSEVIRDYHTACPHVPGIDPDLAIVNFYREQAKMGFHQDKDESRDSLVSGKPVVSISLGDSGDFLYSDEHPDSRKGVEVGSATLESGDILVFGGRSRLVYHSISRIHRHSSVVDGLGMLPGRLNLTLREF